MNNEQREDNFQRINILSRHVPSFHCPDHFSVEKYETRDTSKEKADADLIRRGDFRELVRRNNARGV